jgi:pyridoxamine 5'-phosphate oxidase
MPADVPDPPAVPPEPGRAEVADVTDRLTAVRADLERRGLRRGELAADPIEQLRRWWDHATEVGVHQPETLALATADAAGRPSVRFVLLRGLDRRGLVFFTNLDSRKGRELAANPYAAGVLAWHAVGRQARVAGPVEQVGDAEADAYWATRGRGSQLAARASPQSDMVAGRTDLDRRFAAEEARWEGRPVERPARWSGYRIAPVEVEVWQGRRDRFHDRFRYARVAHDGGEYGWRIDRLAP